MPGQKQYERDINVTETVSTARDKAFNLEVKESLMKHTFKTNFALNL